MSTRSKRARSFPSVWKNRAVSPMPNARSFAVFSTGSRAPPSAVSSAASSLRKSGFGKPPSGISRRSPAATTARRETLNCPLHARSLPFSASSAPMTPSETENAPAPSTSARRRSFPIIPPSAKTEPISPYRKAIRMRSGARTRRAPLQLYRFDLVQSSRNFRRRGISEEVRMLRMGSPQFPCGVTMTASSLRLSAKASTASWMGVSLPKMR